MTIHKTNNSCLSKQYDTKIQALVGKLLKLRFKFQVRT